MMIEDAELRGIYQTASEERLQALDAGLLQLEADPQDAETLNALMREAHSLKGDSNMLGLPEIGEVAHHLESILGQVNRQELSLTATVCDRLAQGLNAMRQMVKEAVTGQPCGIDTATAIALMDGENAAPASTPATADDNIELFGDSHGTESVPPAEPPADTPAMSTTAETLQIADAEMREIFRTASTERLQTLDDKLLQLEQAPEDAELVESLMREAHSLKGDSNMLGQTDLGTLAHQMEHLFGALQRGEETFTPALGDRLAHGLKAMRSLVQQAVTGEPARVNVFYVLAELMGAPASAADSTDSPAPSATEPSPPTASEANGALSTTNGAAPTTNGAAAPLSNGAAPTTNDGELVTVAPAAPSNGSTATVNNSALSSYRIQTIRVPTHNLDALMTQAGELTVTKIRVSHRLGEIEEITNLWEEWSRDLFMNRFLIHDIRQTDQSLGQLAGFHSRTEQYIEQLGNLVTRLQGALYEDATRLDMISGELEEGIRTLRLLPLSTIFNLYPRLVRDLARQEGKTVKLAIEGADTQADKRILEEMKDPLLHMIRNAIDHGIESPAERVRQGKPEVATITLRGRRTPTSIVLEVSDDGRGLDVESIKQTAVKRGVCRPEELETMGPAQIQNLILSPGFSTRTMVTEISGRGVGLDVLRTNVERLKGSIEVISQPGQGCTIRVQLGTTLATAHVLIIAVGEHTYALPVEFVQMACLVDPDEVFAIEGRDTIVHKGQPISVVDLANLLELPVDESSHPAQHSTQRPCIILRAGGEQLGIFVDALIDEQDVVLKPQSQLLKRIRNISGATILGTGEVCMVLNPQDLIQSVRQHGHRRQASAPSAIAAAKPQRALSILLVEDSIATRTQEKRILEAAGYEVTTAVDGMDGFNKLQTRPFDAVVSDVQMPNLDGLGLTQRIRQHREYNETPVVLVTTLASDRDRQRGAEAGANAYITKGSFNQEILLETLQRLT